MKSRKQLSGVILLEIIGLVALLASVFWLVKQAQTNTTPEQVTAMAVMTSGTSTAAATVTLRPSATATQPTATPQPTGTATPTLEPTATPTITVQVIESGSGLRLRESPGTAGDVIRELDAADELQVIGRTEDGLWLEVLTAQGEHGWVNASYITPNEALALVAVTGTAEDAPVADAAYLSGITSHAREIFLDGLAKGNHDFVFSMIGDSNTDNPAFMYPFDVGNYDLGDYAYLQLTVDYFKGSFSRDSAGAHGSYSTARMLDPNDPDKDGRCNAGENSLACEYRLNMPSVALILLGSGDQHTWQGFEARYRQIIEYTIAQGVIPVLITKADNFESSENTAPVEFTNNTIRRLAQEYDVPLLDLRQALTGLPNLGLQADNLHYNSPPDGRTAVFDDAHLQYGFNMRNLTALQALDALRQYVLYAPLDSEP